MKISLGFLSFILILSIYFSFVSPPILKSIALDLKANKCDEILQKKLTIHDSSVETRYQLASATCLIKNEAYQDAKDILIKLESKHNTIDRKGLYYRLSICFLKTKDIENFYKYMKLSLEEGLSLLAFKNDLFNEIKKDSEFIKIKKRTGVKINGWIVLFSYIALQSFLLSILFFSKYKLNKKANILFGFFNLAFSFTLLNYIAYWCSLLQYEKLTYFSQFYIPISYTFGPLLLFYARNITSANNIKNIHYHLSPAYLSMLLIILNQSLGISNIFTTSVIHVLFDPWIRIIHLIIYLYLLFKFVKISNNEKKIKTWLIFLSCSFGCYIFSNVIYQVLINFTFFNQNWDYMISLSMSLFIILISLSGYYQPEIFKGYIQKTTSPNKEKYKKSSLTDLYKIELKSKLTELMEKEKVYRDNSLNLSKLSEMLGTTTHITSQVINETFHEGFHEFINNYRISEAKDILIKKRDMNIIDILFEIGFNNKVTFIKAFKKRVGMTPSYYRKSIN